MANVSHKIKMISIKDIIPNPYQIRKIFEKGELERLSESIKEVGLISPVTVRRASKGYELICGQRRLRACVMAGLSEIPAFVVRAGDLQCAQISLIENLHRKNLGYFEESEAFYNLIMYHRVKKNKAFQMISYPQSAFNEKIRLLSLEKETRRLLENSNLGEEYAKELLRIHNGEKQKEIAQKAICEELPLKKVRSAADEYLKNSIEGKPKDSPKKEFLGKAKTPIYINTVKKTTELLKKHGARFEFSQKETDNDIEFVIKILK